jgi:hypothetical protein
MTSDAERRYGVLGFVDLAAGDARLAASSYFRILEQQRNGRQELTEYPAGPMIAMLELAGACTYCFCDVDPESCANVREVADRLALGSRVEVVEGDGMTAVHGAITRLESVTRTVVYSDPFDHRAVGPAGVSALDLVGHASEVGATVVCWYGYSRADERGWIVDVLRDAAPGVSWWCGDVMICSAHADMFDGDLGAATSPGTGFGLVCANVSPAALERCRGLGTALSAAYEGRPLPDGRPGWLDFDTLTGSER